MTSTSTPVEMVTEMISGIPAMYDRALEGAYRQLWEAGMSILVAYPFQILGILIGLLLFVILLYILTGRWGPLGSLLYHYLYFGILFLVGLINGPEAFLSKYFELACAIILYPLCYLAVRVILTKTGIRQSHGYRLR